MATVTNELKIVVDGKELDELPNRIKLAAKEYKELKAYAENAEIGSDKYNTVVARMQQLRGVLDEHNQGIRANTSSWDKLVNVANEYAPALVGAFTVGAVVSYGTELFNLGTQMDALANKANTVLGDSLSYVEEQARKNATAMGFTTSEYVNQSAAIADLLIPMGFQRQQAAEISTQMINLSGALSEWTGGQKSAAEVSDILNSALLGEREQLKGLGISISQADVDAAMLEKGLKNLTGTAKQQAEAMVTLELVTAKSADAQTAYANGGDSLVRRQAELSAQIKDISESIATTLIPVFEGLVAVASGVVSVISAIGEAFGSSYQSTAQQIEGLKEVEQSSLSLNNTATPLLNTYEELTAKAERLGGTSKLTAAEQDELAKATQGVADTIPGVITGVDEYGNVLSINTEKARAFVAQQVAMGEQAKELRKQLLAQRQTELETGIAQAQDALQKGSIAGIIDVDLKKQNELIQALQQAQAEIKRNAAELDALNGKTQNQPEATKAATGLPVGGVDAKAAEKAKADRQKVADDVKKDATELNEALLRLQHEYEKSKLDSDERILMGISDKYEKEIIKARELSQNKKATEAQRAAATEQLTKLEELRDQELAQKKDELMQAHLKKVQDTNAKLQEETDKYYAAEAKKTEEAAKAKAEAQESILNYIGETSTKTLEILFAEAEQEYQKLLDLANKNGLDSTKLHESYEKKKLELSKKYNNERSKEAANALGQDADRLAKMFRALGDVTSGILNLFDEKARKSSASLKALTLITIGLNTAAGISAAVAAGAGLLFPANIGAIATGVSAVLAGISQAKAVFAGDQKKSGGYTVIGPQDGRSYNADYIGSPNTGLLPPSPKLILANEEGQEYFVAAHHLRNPMVANHVRMIDTITRQYANGGYTDAPSSSSNTIASSGDNSALMQLFNANMAVLATLSDKLDNLNVRISYPDAANIADMSAEAQRLRK